jgi:uncharacterized membrane protein YeiH
MGVASGFASAKAGRKCSGRLRHPTGMWRAGPGISEQSSPEPERPIRHVIELLGAGVFAVSGVLTAGRKSLDWIGVAVIAIVTATGGGTLRDVLLNRHPIFWIADPTYLLVILGATAFTLVYVHFHVPGRRGLLVADAFGLAFFTISGTQIAEQAGLSGLLAVLMGTITGVAGGMVRDVLCAEIPLILRRGQLYASSTIVGATLYLLLERAGAHRDAASLVGMATIVLVRFAAILWRLELPVLSLEETESGSIRRPERQ